MDNLLQDKTWSGVFFLPDKFDERFGGTIHYSPERGVVFQYTQILNRQLLPNCTYLRSFDRLFGVLETGEECTLLYSTTSRNNFPMEIYRGGVGFKVLLIGEHILEEEFVSQIEFSLTGIDDIIDISDILRAGERTIAGINTDFGTCKFYVPLSCNPIYKQNITDYIYHPDINVTNRLGVLLDELTQEHHSPERFVNDFSVISKKKNVIHLEFIKKQSITEAYNSVSRIIHLMSLLRYDPVYPDSLTIKCGQNTQKISVYPTLAIDKISIKNAQIRKDDLPITCKTVNLQDLLSKWFETSDNLDLISSQVQVSTPFVDKTSVYAKLIILAVFFESISNENKKNKIKYQFPFEHYASGKLKRLVLLITKQSDFVELGKYIGNLRDGIAHLSLNIPKSNLVKETSLKDLISIVMAMELICISYIFAKMDIAERLYHQYQDYFMEDRYNEYKIS